MRDIISKKLTIIIESTNLKNISSEVINSLYEFEKSVTSNHELKLSFAVNENIPAESIKNKNVDYISPENWDYWPV